ncbi:MAG: ABC transporter ATP-binding protein, partial [Gemmatimonadales bacterium]
SHRTLDPALRTPDARRTTHHAPIMISISNLEFNYPSGDFRLSIPDLTIGEGETVAFIGPSGSGKTTLLNLIAGIVAPGRGTVITAGSAIHSMSDRERRAFRVRRVGLVFQEFELLEYLSVLDNILLPYRISPALELTAAVRQRAVALAGEVGMASLLHRYPERLSQGERQRVAVCRAVLPQPGLILADEPTGNLDPANKTKVLDILFRFAEVQRSTLVAVTHDHDLLDRFDRAIDFKTYQRTADVAA